MRSREDPTWAPDRGDIVWLQQAGRRPAVVVSPRSYNERVGLALFCPLTTNIKGYPFEVVLPPGGRAAGAILADQVKSLDWRARRATRFDRAPDGTMAEVLGKIGVLVG